ncbi:MAG: response regulator [Myxococcales bacterium]|nr:response regulator [Myxococcales bacterium]
MAEPLETQDLAVIGLAYARAFTEDLRALVGAEITIGTPRIETVRADSVIEDEQPLARTTCKNKKNAEEQYHCLVSRSMAVTLACLLMGHTEERLKEMRELPLDEETLDAFGEVMNLGTAVLSRLFTDKYGLPPVGVLSTVELTSPMEDTEWLVDAEYLRCHFPVNIPGYGDESLVIVFPPNVAHEWFGVDIGPFAESSGSEEDQGELDEDAIESTSIVFIEPNEETRNEMEDLEDDMIHSIWTIDPEEFDPDELDEFAEVGAFIIEWDLDIRTGLDFVECLREDEHLREVPILMMSATPSEAKVRTAIRSGANSFVRKPIDLDELQSRLDPLLLARQRAEA